MEQHKLPLVLVNKLRLHVGEQYENEAAWQACLDSLDIRVHIPVQREQSFWPNVNTDSGST